MPLMCFTCLARSLNCTYNTVKKFVCVRVPKYFFIFYLKQGEKFLLMLVSVADQQGSISFVRTPLFTLPHHQFISFLPRLLIYRPNSPVFVYKLCLLTESPAFVYRQADSVRPCLSSPDRTVRSVASEVQLAEADYTRKEHIKTFI